MYSLIQYKPFSVLEPHGFMKKSLNITRVVISREKCSVQHLSQPEPEPVPENKLGPEKNLTWEHLVACE